MVVAYDIFLVLYQAAIRFAAIFNTKARAWTRGRSGLINEIRSKVEGNNQKLIWIHSASLGEFEQGRTLIEEIKKQYPSHKILVTFFSPSGYEVRKNYKAADYIFYLPMDGKNTSKKFIEIVQPSLAIFIKYELWYHYLSILREKKIPTVLISAIILPNQSYFGMFGKFFQNMLNMFTHIFVQDENSFELLASLNIKTPFSISGDTRFDRVLQVSQEDFSHTAIEIFCKDQPVLIAGSTWQEDEELLSAVQKAVPDLKFIIAPHEIHASHISFIKNSFEDAVCLSKFNGEEAKRVLIIDSIGMLSKLYRYATIAYVGGGFNKAGIHNILEAAAYGKFVFWGPRFERSAEARRMIEIKCGSSVKTSSQFIKEIKQLLNNKLEREEKNNTSKHFVEQNMGATSRIMVFLQNANLLNEHVYRTE